MRRTLAALTVALTACGPVTVALPGADAAPEAAALDAGADVQAESAAPPDAPLEAAAVDVVSDAATTDTATDAAPDVPLPACVTPDTASCVNVGCRFAPAILRSCDPGEAELPVYGADFCERRATLIVIVAGWCPPNMAEAPEIERYITQGYAARGVRVITVVVQKPDRSVADAAFCNAWRSNYSLTSTMATDPRMATGRYFPDMTLPSNMIVDRQGTIRWRTNGTSAGLAAMRAALDEVLATP